MLEDAHGRLAFLWRCRQCGRVPCSDLATCWGRLPAETMHHCAIIALKRAGRPCDQEAETSMNVNDADKTHVGAWDRDGTAQNVPDDA